jgi:predicted DNA-binding ribbon-helix-helix protein
MSEVHQTRTLALTDGQRTSLRFDHATWRAIEWIANGEGLRWTKWVRKVLDDSPAGSMHTVIRAEIAKRLVTAEPAKPPSYAELVQLWEATKRMHAADDRYGCGFYSDAEWVGAYQETRQLAGIPAQE